jgi:hypothetical protein
MDLFITADCNEESGIGGVIDEICEPTQKHFATGNYGASLLGMGVVLMCRDKYLNFKRRIRFTKKDKVLYMDVMLDIDEMKPASPKKRRQIIFKRLVTEIPEIITKYKFPDFKFEQFSNDLNAWFNELGKN